MDKIKPLTESNKVDQLSSCFLLLKPRRGEEVNRTWGFFIAWAQSGGMEGSDINVL